MAVKTFTSTRLSPPMWDSQHIPAGGPSGDIVLDVAEDAPPASDRSLLKTRVRVLPSPHSGFNAYVATHDVVMRVSGTYPTAASAGDPDSDDLEDQCYTRPRSYNVFELRDAPGQVYTTMPLAQIKQMIRRFHETHGASHTRSEPRIVNLHNLESTLKGAPGINVVVHGYDLENVLWSTPVSRLDIDANETTANLEAQNTKSSAENMRVLKLYVQAIRQMVSARVGVNGIVKFPNYPGDEEAMYVLATLEPFIANCLQVV